MQIAPQSITSITTPLSVTSNPATTQKVLYWVVAAAAVALLYQAKPIRPYVAGIVVLVILGMLLKNEPMIASQLQSI